MRWYDVSSDEDIRQLYGLITTRFSEGVARLLQPSGDIDLAREDWSVWDIAYMSRQVATTIMQTEDEVIKRFVVHLPDTSMPNGLDPEETTLYLVGSGIAGLMFVTPGELEEAKSLMKVSPKD